MHVPPPKQGKGGRGVSQTWVQTPPVEAAAAVHCTWFGNRQPCTDDGKGKDKVSESPCDSVCFAQVRQAQTRHERSRVTVVPTRSVAVISANQDPMALLRVVVVTLCALAVCGATAAVATVDSDDAAAPAGGFTISGKVGAAPKRSGLSVWLNGRQHHTLTLMNGSFRFTDLPAGAPGWCAGGEH